MNISNFLAFTIANLLTSILGGYLVKKKHPEIPLIRLVGNFLYWILFLLLGSF